MSYNNLVNGSFTSSVELIKSFYSNSELELDSDSNFGIEASTTKAKQLAI